jgi:uroporphyrinogen-III synthase
MVTRLPDRCIAGNTKGMAPQSHAPQLLLTRPKAQSQRFARSLRAAFAERLHIMIAPLMQTAFISPAIATANPTGLIFSSETGVAAYQNLAMRPVAPVWCIGERTAEAARKAGLETVLVAKDARELILRMTGLQPDGPLLHLRGEHSHGSIATSLTDAGIPATSAVVYAQHAIPLAPRALRLLAHHPRVVVPLFSARSAALFCAAAPIGAPLYTVALSQAVADAVPADRRAAQRIAPYPDADGMLQAVVAMLREPSSA